MSDLKTYIQKRKKDDADFAKDFDSGYIEFKIGEIDGVIMLGKLT